MNQKVKLILTGSLFLFIIGLASCESDCGPFPNKFKIIGLDWHNYNATYTDTPDTDLMLNDIENDSVVFNEYSILIVPIQETYFAQNFNNRKYKLITTAYACSPLIPETDEKIDSIVIKSTKDFNENYPSGSDLAALFDVVVRDLSNNIYDKKFSLKDYLGTNPSIPNELALILREQPDLETDFEFLVQYYQEGIDNDYFEFTTNKIVIQRDI